jgi:cytochrome P450
MSYDTDASVDLPPVADWAHDWDWLDPAWGPNAVDIWHALRERGCTMATTERYGRAFMPLTMQAVSQVAHDTEHFSSAWVSVARPDATRRPAPPITSDPPAHHAHRRLLLPGFSPKAIAPMEAELRQYCRSLVAALDGRVTADAAVEYSQHIPVHAICQLVGVPESDADMFRDWIFRNFQLAPRDNRVRDQLFVEMAAYFDALIARRLDEPADDLATLVAHAELDGEPVPEALRRGYLNLLILAGIDTTWSAIGSGLFHLATHPADRDRLAGVADDDALWMTATEEVLRYYAPVTMARKVIADTEVAGCPVHAGEQMLLTFPAANHDPAVFDRAGEFLVDREVNRHVAFGLGIHRCIGSNLARLELVVALQEWMRAFPGFALDPDGETTWSMGRVRGPRSLPVRLSA